MKLSVYSFLFLSFIFSQNLHLDGVVAVVGNKTILGSDLNSSMKEVGKNFFGDDFSFSNLNQKELVVFKKDVLDLLIGNKLILLSAEEDSTLSVSYDQINSFLDENIQSLIDVEFKGSLSSFEESLGSSVVDYKSSQWEGAQELLLTEEKKRSLLQGVGVTQKEVLLAFNYYKKERPFSPEAFTFTLYETPVKPETKNPEEKFVFLASIKDSLSNGLLGFDLAIKKHSKKDPIADALNGWWLRGELSNIFPKSPSLEKSLFGLSVGSYSSPIKTRLGFHLFLLEDRAGEKIKIKQLFHPLENTSIKPAPIIKKHKELVELCFNDPGFFDSLAVENKSFISKENYNGVYSSIGFDEDLLIANPFYKKLSSVLNNIENESFSSPFVFNSSVFTVYRYIKEEERFLKKEDLYKNWGFFEDMALQNKRNVFIDEWITKERKKHYVKVLFE